MAERNVQGFEVVPVVFDFGPLDGREAEPAHDLLHPLDGLRDGMQPPDSHRSTRQRDIEGFALCAAFCFGEPRGGRLKGGFDRLFHRIEFLPSGWLVGLIDLAHALLHGLEAARFGTQELDPRFFKRTGTARAVERISRFGG